MSELEQELEHDPKKVDDESPEEEVDDDDEDSEDEDLDDADDDDDDADDGDDDDDDDDGDDGEARDEIADASAYFAGLFERMGLDVRCEVSLDGKFLRVDVTGPDAAELISGGGAGARSEVLEALQLVSSRSLYGGSSGRAVVLDAAGFRDARLALLAGAAERLAETVEGAGTTAQIHAINAFDRRAVHVALEKRRSVRTESDGSGVQRTLLVKKA